MGTESKDRVCTALKEPPHFKALMLVSPPAPRLCPRPPADHPWSGACRPTLTCVAVVDHGVLAPLDIVARQVQSRQVGVVLHLLPLHVDGRLSLPPTGGVLLGPVLLIQRPL